MQIEMFGQTYGLKFNQGTLMIARKYIDQKEADASSVYAIVYAALKSNAIVKRQDFTRIVDGKQVEVTFEDVCDEVDNLSEETLTGIVKAFNESDIGRKLIKENENDEKKSQLTTIPNVSESVVAT